MALLSARRVQRLSLSVFSAPDPLQCKVPVLRHSPPHFPVSCCVGGQGGWLCICAPDPTSPRTTLRVGDVACPSASLTGLQLLPDCREGLCTNSNPSCCVLSGKMGAPAASRTPRLSSPFLSRQDVSNTETHALSQQRQQGGAGDTDWARWDKAGQEAGQEGEDCGRDDSELA